MKKLVMILMAFCLTMPATVNAQSKAVKKEVKAKMKDYKKRGYEVFGTSRTLESVLTKHFTTLEEKDGKVMEIVGFARAKSYNVAATAAQNSAANRYATTASAQVKGRMLADMANDVANLEAEFDKFYAAYEAKVEQEIRGELRPSFSVMKKNDDGTIQVEAFYLVDEDAASRARINAFKNSQAESAAAQKYAQRVSDFVNERVIPEN
jgi:hypothetical protein